MILDYSQNGFKMVFEVTDGGAVVLKHFGKKDEVVAKNKTNPKASVVNVHVSGDNPNDHHFFKHTGNSADYTLKYVSHAYYENELGGRISVFSGTPVAEFNLVEAFSFLTYTRKEQLIRLLKRSINLPLYCPFDSDVYMKAAKMEDGRIFASLFNLSLDTMEKAQIACDFTPRKVYKLMPDGGEREIDFSFENGLCTLDTECKTLDPVVIFIEK